MRLAPALWLTTLLLLPAIPSGAGTPAPATVAAPAAAPAPPPSGAGVPEYRPAPGPGTGSLAWDWLRPLGALAVVLGLLAIGLKLARRWPGLLPGGSGRGALEIVGRLPLGPKETVCLVRAGQEVLLLGVGGGGVTLLHRLPAEAGRPAGRPGPPVAEPPQARFRELAARVREVQALWGRSRSWGEQP